MKASDFDKRFDKGQSIIESLDLTKASRPNFEQKRVNVDFPVWMVESLDHQASKMGVSRQAIIKMWLADKLEHN